MHDIHQLVQRMKGTLARGIKSHDERVEKAQKDLERIQKGENIEETKKAKEEETRIQNTWSRPR